jgi:hypothetical protein
MWDLPEEVTKGYSNIDESRDSGDPFEVNEASDPVFFDHNPQSLSQAMQPNLES